MCLCLTCLSVSALQPVSSTLSQQYQQRQRQHVTELYSSPLKPFLPHAHSQHTHAENAQTQQRRLMHIYVLGGEKRHISRKERANNNLTCFNESAAAGQSREEKDNLMRMVWEMRCFIYKFIYLTHTANKVSQFFVGFAQICNVNIEILNIHPCFILSFPFPTYLTVLTISEYDCQATSSTTFLSIRAVKRPPCSCSQ